MITVPVCGTQIFSSQAVNVLEVVLPENGSNGGADGYCKNLEFCNMYLNSNLSSRYNQEAVYKCLWMYLQMVL